MCRNNNTTSEVFIQYTYRSLDLVTQNFVLIFIFGITVHYIRSHQVEAKPALNLQERRKRKRETFNLERSNKSVEQRA